MSGAQLVPLEQNVRRPRVDVVMTLSGVFRDLFPLQIRLLAEAALLAAQADEPLDDNPVRRHALASQTALGCDLETAALRVFGNADGAYGANVNLMIDASAWSDDAELGDAFARRKAPRTAAMRGRRRAPELFTRALAGVDLSYQMVDSVELGATDVDQYVDSLGGLGRAVQAARGRAAPVYMGDATGAEGKVRTLDEQVAFESRTRLLNPRWHEGMLRAGYEGVREDLEPRHDDVRLVGDDAASVPAWVYRDVCATFVTDDAMRERMAALNPHATLRMAGRLLEASDRGYWAPETRRSTPCERRAPSWKTASKECSRDDGNDGWIALARTGRRRRQRAGAHGPAEEADGGAHAGRLWEGGHRQVDDVVEPVGGVRAARQARAADRVRPEARLDVHAHEAHGADGDRRAGRRRVPRRGAAARGLRVRPATRACSAWRRADRRRARDAAATSWGRR